MKVEKRKRNSKRKFRKEKEIESVARFDFQVTGETGGGGG